MKLPPLIRYAFIHLSLIKLISWTLYSQLTISQQIELRPEAEQITTHQYQEKSADYQLYLSISEESIRELKLELQRPNLTKKDSVDINFDLARIYYFQYDFEHFSLYSNKALRLYEALDNETKYQLQFQYQFSEALLALYAGKASKALAFILDVKQVVDEKSVYFIEVQRVLASVYRDLGDNEQAQESLLACLSSGVNNENSDGLTSIYSDLASLFVDVEKLDSAKNYLDLIQEEYYSLETHLIYAEYYHKIDMPLKSIQQLDWIIAIAQKQGKMYWEPLAMLLKANILYDLKDYSAAETNWKKTRLKFIESNDAKHSLLVAERLYSYYKIRGQFEQALIYHEELKNLNDDILYTSYQAVTKGIEDSYILKSNESEFHGVLQSQNANSMIIQKQRIFNFLMIISSLLLGILALYYKRSSRMKGSILQESNSQLKELEKSTSQIKDEIQILNQNLNSRVKELMTSTLQIKKRESELEAMLVELRIIYTDANAKTKLQLSKAISRLRSSLNEEDYWLKFSIYFNELNPQFYAALKARSQALTNNEIRHCAYMKIGLSNKEVSDMLSLSPRTVEMTRYRIKKKLSIEKDHKLQSFIESL